MSQPNYPERIGEFLAVFSLLESQTYRLLRVLPDDKVQGYALGVNNFEPRVRLLQALLRCSEIEARAELEELLEESLGFQKYRNGLSHNSVWYDICVSKDSSKHHTNASLICSKSGEQIPQALEQLQTRYEGLARIAMRVLELCSQIEIENQSDSLDI